MLLYDRLAKYIIAFAVTASLVGITHSLFIYAFADSQLVPDTGGAVSIGIVGTATRGNPFLAGTNIGNDLILSLTAQSMIEKRLNSSGSLDFFGVLANCDLASLVRISCTLRQGATFSDGRPVRNEDVIATYEFFKATTENAIARQLVTNVRVSENNGAIIFAQSIPNVSILDALSLPIIPASFARGSLTENTIDPDTIPLSGEYVFERIESDSDDIGATKVVFKKREDIVQRLNGGPYVERYIFKFFTSPTALINGEKNLSILVDAELPRDTLLTGFKKIVRPLNDYVTAFISIEATPNREIRAAIRDDIARYVAGSEENNGTRLPDLFFGSGTPVWNGSGSQLKALLSSGGYLSLEARIAAIESEPLVVEGVATQKITTNTYIKTPTNLSEYVNDGTNEVLITGTFPPGTTAVSVNDYRLQQFNASAGTFAYRASVSRNNLKSGENVYAINFLGNNGNRIARETITIHAIADPILQAEKKANLGSANTEEVAAARTRAEQLKAARIIELKSLSGELLYNKNLQPFLLKIAAHDSPIEQLYASKIVQGFRSQGIDAVVATLTNADLEAMITTEKKDYDVLITGVHIGAYRDLFAFLHSGQARDGLNFAEVRNPSLDFLLEGLRAKSAISESSREQVRKIVRDDALMLPLFAPERYDFIAKSVLGTELFSLSDRPLQDIYARSKRLTADKSYALSEYWDFVRSHISL